MAPAPVRGVIGLGRMLSAGSVWAPSDTGVVVQGRMLTEAPSVALQGQFSAGLKLPGVGDSVGLDITLSLTASLEGVVTAGLEAKTTTPIQFESFKWLLLSDLEVGGYLSASLEEGLALERLWLGGGVTVFGVSGGARFMVGAGWRWPELRPLVPDSSSEGPQCAVVTSGSPQVRLPNKVPALRSEACMRAAPWLVDPSP